MAEVCRPCPLSRLGCGPEADSEETTSGSRSCSPHVMGVVFVVPLGTAVAGAALAGPQPLEQLLGALVGLTAGVVLAIFTHRRLDRDRGNGA